MARRMIKRIEITSLGGTDPLQNCWGGEGDYFKSTITLYLVQEFGIITDIFRNNNKELPATPMCNIIGLY